MEQKTCSYSNPTISIDPSSDIGRGTVIEYVVLETMGNCSKMVFNHCYDLYSHRLHKVNVKSSKLYKKANYWSFSINAAGFVPHYYVCVALDELYDKILHVWEIPGKSEVVGFKRIVVTNTLNGLERFRKYEVEPSKYNDVFQNMDISKYPEFRGLTKESIKLVRRDPRCVKLEAHIKTYFDRNTGIIGNELGDSSLELSNECYPLYDHNNAYHGYIEKDKFVDVCEEHIQDFIESILNIEGEQN